ncbi:hypothetical protein I79_014227 [Cricetulus griseus]|uniref:Uncharacterized protein n=1 Tax=Cricetulus griseus TaxID=10029 RepID=G3HTJ9_CRIGR|nr:hypothetical protein I79_014227 [Cricetulus griseus]
MSAEDLSTSPDFTQVIMPKSNHGQLQQLLWLRVLGLRKRVNYLVLSLQTQCLTINFLSLPSIITYNFKK